MVRREKRGKKRYGPISISSESGIINLEFRRRKHTLHCESTRRVEGRRGVVTAGSPRGRGPQRKTGGGRGRVVGNWETKGPSPEFNEGGKFSSHGNPKPGGAVWIPW